MEAIPKNFTLLIFPLTHNYIYFNVAETYSQVTQVVLILYSYKYLGDLYPLSWQLKHSFTWATLHFLVQF